MAFKLKILLNDWFANQMRVPIDLSQAEDIDVYQSGMWSRRKKQQSVLKLLTDPSDSGVPVWLKPHVDIYLVQRLIAILIGKSNDKEIKLLHCVASQRPIFKELLTINKTRQLSELHIEEPFLDYLACQAFMNRKNKSATIEGNVAADMLFNAINNQTLSLTDLKHLESIAFATPNETIAFIGKASDGLMNVESIDEKRRLFFNYCIQSTMIDKIAPKAFEALHHQYPKEMDELLSWLAISPVPRFSSNILKKPLTTYQIPPNTSQLALIKQLSAHARELQKGMQGKICHPGLMTLFHEGSNNYLASAEQVHKKKLKETKQTFDRAQKTLFRLSLVYAVIGILFAVAAHMLTLAPGIVLTSAMVIGILGFCVSQYLILRGFKNDERNLGTFSSWVNLNVFAVIAAVLCIYIAPIFMLNLPCLLAAVGSIMPLLAQRQHQFIVHNHIETTPLTQSKFVDSIVRDHDLTSMFVVNQDANLLGFNMDNVVVPKGV